MAEVWDGFFQLAMTVQQAMQGSLTPGQDPDAPRQAWRDLVAEERRALANLEINEEGIPTHIIPAALPENPDAFEEPWEGGGEAPWEDDAASLRQVQDQAYEESLLDDRRRAEQRMRDEEEAAMAQAMAASLEEEEERQKRAKAALLGPEPPADAPGVCALAIRMPDGRRLTRRLLKTDTVGLLRAWLASQDAPRRFVIAMDFPRRRFDDDDQTLLDADMFPRAAINVLEEEEEEEDKAGNANVGNNNNNFM